MTGLRSSWICFSYERAVNLVIDTRRFWRYVGEVGSIVKDVFERVQRQ